MENDREVDSVLMNISRTSGGLVAAITFSARVSFKLLQFLFRLAKKGMVAGGLADAFKDFSQKTGGEFTVYNIPLSAEKAKTMAEMNQLELKLQKEKNPVSKAMLRQDIKRLGATLPELEQLKEIGLSHCVLPKLNGSEQTIQVAVAKKDDQMFKNWFLNHLSTELKGGEKNLEGIKVFTEGNYSILNMPFESEEDLGIMLSDFQTMGINYAVLPDLNVGDGYTQIAIPNSDRSQVEQWFKLFKEKALSEGRENIKDMYLINNDSYASMAEINADDYINKSEQPYQDVQAAFEQESTPIPWTNKLAKENSPESVKLMQDDNFYKITINREKLVDDHVGNHVTKRFEQEFGYFTSRIPGTYGDKEQTLVLPADQVFTTDNEKTFLAFLDKRKDYFIVSADGNMKKHNAGEIKDMYDIVDRGFKAIALKKSKDITKYVEVDVFNPLRP